MKEHDQLYVFATVKHHNIALLFANYVRTQSCNVVIEKHGEGFVLLCDYLQQNAVSALFDEFIKNPHQSKYQFAAWEQAKPEPVITNSTPLLQAFQERLFDHAGIVTLSIFILCWLVFIFSALGFDWVLFTELKFYQQLSLSYFLKEPYRIVTPILIHFSLMHVAFNSIWWWQLGGDIEKKIGKIQLINLLVISAVISNLGQYIVSGSNFGGLSGVVYALVGFVWCLGHLQPKSGLQLSNVMMGFLFGWLALGFLNWLPVNTANTAHLLGLLIGCIMALIKSRLIRSIP